MRPEQKQGASVEELTIKKSELEHELATLTEEDERVRGAVELLRNGKLGEALDQNANFAPTYSTLGKVLAHKGGLPETQPWCEQAIAKDKLRSEPYFALSLIYRHKYDGTTPMRHVQFGK